MNKNAQFESVEKVVVKPPAKKEVLPEIRTELKHYHHMNILKGVSNERIFPVNLALRQ